jgi:hypothetical protein
MRMTMLDLLQKIGSCRIERFERSLRIDRVRSRIARLAILRLRPFQLVAIRA